MPGDPIKHVVVLMFENHSFDQMLGACAGVDGADPARFNADSTGQRYFQTEAEPSAVDPDPMHETDHVLRQLAGGNRGFVSEYEREYANTQTPATPEKRQKIMNCFRRDSLPALHALAENFTVCDNWFSSVPGPTWANRFFVHSGTSLGRVQMPDNLSHPLLYLGYIQDTIYERLNAGGISWRIYFGDLPQSIVLMQQWKEENRRNYRPMEQFYIDAARLEPDFPAYTFIEPRYYDPLHLEGPQNDDHPPHLPGPAQELLAAVYNSLRRNEPLWNSTLLVVLYDEHGGFYDHLPTPPAEAPDPFNFDNFDFKQLGVRVPAVLASPWVKKGVLSTPFDHTSLLRYLIDKWGLGRLTKRSDVATSILEAILDAPRADTPASLPMPPLPRVALAVAPLPLNEHQKALLEFTKLLGPVLPLGVQPLTAEPMNELAAAKRRVAAFLQ